MNSQNSHSHNITEHSLPTDRREHVKYQVFRNYTVEPLLAQFKCSYSAYGDISVIDFNANEYVFFYFVPIVVESALAAREVDSFREKLQILQNTLPPEKNLTILTLEPMRNFSWVETNHLLENAVHAFNAFAQQLAHQHTNIHCLNLRGFFASVLDSAWASIPLFDWKFFYTHQTPINPHLGKAFSEWFSEKMKKISLQRKKLLVLDLDGTLWSGVVGEDDAQIGGQYPGNAFFDIQKMIVALRDTGVLLAIISKNNLADVEEFFSHHGSMPLRLSDFVSVFCNWISKSENLQTLLSELNLGPESVVMLDDSPYERELVKRSFPLATVPDLPTTAYELVPAVQHILRTHFSAYEVTNEDRSKSEQYEMAAKASALRANLNYDDFLRTLEMKLKITPLNQHNRSRFLQITQKTNQFNLTTLRLTDAQLREREAEGQQAFVLDVTDRFGSPGIVGGVLLSFMRSTPDSAPNAHVEAFMLSCRVLGRDIEYAFFNAILNMLFKNGTRCVTGHYVRTARNAAADSFFDKLGFALQETTDERKAYALELCEPRTISPHFTITGGICD